MTPEVPVSDDPHSTIPAGLEALQSKPVMKMIPVRVHLHDHTLLRSLLKRDKMTFTKFTLICIKGYLDAHPHMIKMIKDYRALELVPQGVKDSHVLSFRERQALPAEI